MKYSKRTLHFAVFSTIILIVFYIFSHIERNPSWQLDDLIGFLIILLVVCSLMGVLTGFIALTEGSNKRKWVGLLVNLAIVIGIVMYLSRQFS